MIVINFLNCNFKNQNNYILNDYFNKININSQGAYPLERNYIYNDFIKTNENTIYFISAQYFGINIYNSNKTIK